MAAPRPAAAQAADRPVTLRADIWCPFNCDPGAATPGYVVELARDAFALAGMTIDYRLSDWSTAVKDARAGRIDGVLGGIPADLAGLRLSLEGVGHTRFAVATQRYVQPRINPTLSALARLRVGVVAGYKFDAKIDAHIDLHAHDIDRIVRFHGRNAQEAGLQALERGWIDAFLDDPTVMSYVATQIGAADRLLLQSVRGSAPTPLHMAFSDTPRGRMLATRFDEGVRALRQSGALRIILQRYGQSDWAERE